MAPSFATGTIVAGFRIESLIGEGAMGAVYLAEEPVTGRRVALKLLVPDLAGDERFRQRFLRESQLAASLDHPHIVATLGSGEQSGVLYLATEYVQGPDLRALLKREQRLEPERALGLVAQVAEALDAAHASGLVHRDVKPGNILVATEGDREHAYLCDFGLARHVSSPSSLTGARGFVGTIDYVPPEQIEGGTIDRRSDVYSLGCVLFECLAGERPFERESELAVVFAHLNEPPPRLSQLRSGVPEALDRVFEKALAKSPGDRYQSCGELVAATRTALQGGTVARRRLRRGLALSAAAALVATAAVVAGIVVTARGGAHGFQPGTLLLDLTSGRQLASLPRSELPAAIYPLYANGRFWVVNVEPLSFVEVAPRTGKILRTIPAPAGFGSDEKATYQPYAVDGNALWVGSNDDLVKIAISTGRVVERLPLDRMVGVKGLTESVAVGMGLVWVSRDAGAGQVIGFDPATRRVLYRFDDVVHHDDIAYGDGLIWTVDFAGAMVIDPRAGAVTDIPDVTHTSRFAAAGGGYGWAADPAKGVVYKLDRNGGVADTYRTGLGASNMSFSHGVLWVANEDEGTVSGIDAITGEQTSYHFGHPLPVQAAGGGVLLAALEPGGSVEDSIDALHGRVLRLFSQQGEFGDGAEPALNRGSAAFQIDFATCAKLLNYRDASGAAALTLRPEIAAAMPALSADRRTYTFRVRSGYRFSPPSNQPVTAETFRYSIERALSPRLGSFQPAAAYVTDIAGERAFRKGKAAHIAGLRGSGDRLSITLTRPSPDFLERLALPFFCPVPLGTRFEPGAMIRGGDPLAGGGTIPSAGPYYIAAFTNDKLLILRRNPNYHGPRPHGLDAIALREGLDPTVEVDRIRHAGWDGIISSGHHTEGSPPLDPLLDPRGPLATRYGKPSSPGGHYVAVPLPATTFIALDATRGPFADATVRRAAALAIDRSELAGLAGQAVTNRLLPPTLPGLRGRRHFAPRTDPDGARKLLGGRRINAVMALARGCSPCAREARAVRSDLAHADIDVTLKRYADPLAAASHPGADIDLLVTGTQLDYPDAASFLGRVLLEDVPRPWLRPQVRHEIERVLGLSGATRQTEAVALADRLFGSSTVIPWGTPVQGEFFSPRLGCRMFPAMSYGVDLDALCRSS
jgi:tRNA A-37 threonylcarbamoyl transferase component Bud32